MIYTVQHMFKVLRFGVNEDITYGATSVDMLINALDNAQNRLYDLLLMHREDMLAHYYDLTLNGSERYYLPDYITNFDRTNILMITDETSSDSPVDTLPTSWKERMQFREWWVNTDREPYSLVDNYIEFPLKPTSGTFRIWYSRRPVGFLYGTVGSGSTSSNIVFPTTPTAPTYGVPVPANDYYNGMMVSCNSEVKLITDYVASTKTATINGTWTTTPTNSHTMDLVSPLPEKYHELLVDIAKRSLKVDAEDDDSMILRKIMEDAETMAMNTRKTQTQMPAQIRRIART